VRFVASMHRAVWLTLLLVAVPPCEEEIEHWLRHSRHMDNIEAEILSTELMMLLYSSHGQAFLDALFRT